MEGWEWVSDTWAESRLRVGLVLWTLRVGSVGFEEVQEKMGQSQNIRSGVVF